MTVAPQTVGSRVGSQLCTGRTGATLQCALPSSSALGAWRSFARSLLKQTFHGHPPGQGDGRADQYSSASRIVRTRVVTSGLAGSGEPQASSRRSEEHTSELQSLMRISYSVFCLNT